MSQEIQGSLGRTVSDELAESTVLELLKALTGMEELGPDQADIVLTDANSSLDFDRLKKIVACYIVQPENLTANMLMNAYTSGNPAAQRVLDNARNQWQAFEPSPPSQYEM